MLIGIPKESRNNENRVAITPEILKKIIKLGYQVQIEKSAGLKSSFPDQLYLIKVRLFLNQKKFGNLPISY
ncbi:MAG: hypothetical protein Ct9H90mP18_03210 [Gammaproteobacteria bacterium]|nr:MAG: hypothetical protein Ct9H90mP18_03210 [Gammaproteobacteria bacterium]